MTFLLNMQSPLHNEQVTIGTYAYALMRFTFGPEERPKDVTALEVHKRVWEVLHMEPLPPDAQYGQRYTLSCVLRRPLELAYPNLTATVLWREGRVVSLQANVLISQETALYYAGDKFRINDEPTIYHIKVADDDRLGGWLIMAEEI